jgi:hypothetical protein
MKGVKKQHLPGKICLTCGRPFVWRKKWQKSWDNVLYCSEGCRSHKNRAISPQQFKEGKSE